MRSTVVMMGLLTNLLLGSSFAAIVAAGQAPQWDGVRPTTVAESLRADGIGFSPMPTEPPEFEMLKKRGANTFPPYVCGFVTGDQGMPNGRLKIRTFVLTQS